MRENLKRKKVLLISSSGGHFEELKQLNPLSELYDLVWVTEKTSYDLNVDYYLKQTGSKSKSFIIDMIYNTFLTIYIWLKERPDVVISTGTMVAIPSFILGKICRKKTIFIETFARIYDGTKTGLFLYRYADLFIYQWESLKEVYPNGMYGGSIF